MQSAISNKRWGLLWLNLALSSAHANGSYVQDKGAIASGLINAGVTARAGDASTLYYNPAGMTRLPGMLQAGLDTTFPSVDTTNTGSVAATPGTGGAAAAFPGAASNDPIDPTPVPHLYAVYPVPDTSLWLGLAVTVPFGLNVEYADDWFGRYDSIKSKLTTLDIAPTAAWRFSDQWSAGGGIDVQYADGELRSALPDPLNPGGPTAATDGTSSLEGNDWSLGFNIGILWQPTTRTRVGAHYRSRISHTLEGDLEVSGLSGPLAGFNGKQPGTTDIDLPGIASLALAYEWSEEFTSYLEGNWYGWNTFREIRAQQANGETALLRPQKYSDSWGIASGIEYQLNDTWQLRSGIRYETTPTNDTWRGTGIPDEDSIIVAAGASAQLNDHWAIDAAYQHLFVASAKVAVSNDYYAGTPLQSSVTTRAELESYSNIVSLDLRYEF